MAEIPQMTHELSRYWKQPNPSDILIDERHAVMNSLTFNALAEYSLSVPSGVYDGKMWKANTLRRGRPTWLLKWYDRGDSPMHCALKIREILIV